VLAIELYILRVMDIIGAGDRRTTGKSRRQ